MQVSKSKKGFTLIEIIVVITIVGFIILTAFYTLGRASQQVRLQMSVEQVASNLRFDQTQVKSGHLSGTDMVCRGYTFTAGNSYEPVSAEYIASVGCSSTLLASPDLFYATGVEVNQIVPEGSASAVAQATILFEPPNGTVHFLDVSENEINVSSVDLTFVYTLDDYPFTRLLSVNRAGQITYDISN